MYDQTVWSSEDIVSCFTFRSFDSPDFEEPDGQLSTFLYTGINVPKFYLDEPCVSVC